MPEIKSAPKAKLVVFRAINVHLGIGESRTTVILGLVHKLDMAVLLGRPTLESS